METSGSSVIPGRDRAEGIRRAESGRGGLRRGAARKGHGRMAMTIGSKTRRARPGLETLEGRQLLSGAGSSLLQTVRYTPPGVSPLRRLAYTAPGGAKVVVELFGVGEMNGTTIDPDGALNLRFSGTNQQTGIIATVVGGTGRAPLRSVQSLDLPAGSLTGVGGTLIDIVDLKDFDLVPGGRINLTPGVHVLSLDSTAADTQINLRQVPTKTTETTSTGSPFNTGTTISTARRPPRPPARRPTGSTTVSTSTGTRPRRPRRPAPRARRPRSCRPARHRTARPSRTRTPRTAARR